MARVGSSEVKVCGQMPFVGAEWFLTFYHLAKFGITVDR